MVADFEKWSTSGQNMYKMKVEAVSPIIATIIVVTITLAIAFAVVGWLFGLWSGIAGGTPQIQITNVKVYKSDDTPIAELYIVNKGSGSDRILKAELIKGSNPVGNSTISTDTITANFAGWVTIAFNALSLNVGNSIIIKVYFEKSGVQTIPATVSPSPSSS